MRRNLFILTVCISYQIVVVKSQQVKLSLYSNRSVISKLNSGKTLCRSLLSKWKWVPNHAKGWQDCLCN